MQGFSEVSAVELRAFVEIPAENTYAMPEHAFQRKIRQPDPVRTNDRPGNLFNNPERTLAFIGKICPVKKYTLSVAGTIRPGRGSIFADFRQPAQPRRKPPNGLAERLYNIAASHQHHR